MPPVSIRMNNPGAINIASWVEDYPGFVSATETTAGNRTVRFETAEDGVAAWWELMRRYGLSGIATVQGIINRYCGSGRAAAAKDYVKSVVAQTGMLPGERVDLWTDYKLLPFAKAMFRHEAGKPTPLSDLQIMEGFRRGRAHSKGVYGAPTRPASASNAPAPSQGSGERLPGLLGLVISLLQALLKAFVK
jgi:hypothetical protein